MATQLTTIENNNEIELFSFQQRQAKMFAMSPLVPESLRKGTPDEALANCYIALKLAETMGETPLVLMQHIHIVKGKAGFSAQYMIARANKSGIFEGRIDWKIDRNPDNLAVTAHAILKSTGEEVSFCCDMKMAQGEGWTSNPKYKSMPELMLRYRSATFLVRLYAPDVMLGYQTAEEHYDMIAAAGPSAQNSPLTAAALIDQAATYQAPAGGEQANSTPAHNPKPSPEADYDGAASTDPRHAMAMGWIDALADGADLGEIEREFVKHRAAMPDHLIDLVEAAIGDIRNPVEGS